MNLTLYIVKGTYAYALQECRELYFTCSSQGVFCRDTYLWLDCAAHLIVDGDAIEMLRKCYAQRNPNDAVACTSTVNSLKETMCSQDDTVKDRPNAMQFST